VLILEKSKKLPKLPDSLEVLKIGKCETISSLPKNLRVLKIQVCEKILSFPEYLEIAKIYHFQSIARFKKLKVFETLENASDILDNSYQIKGMVRIKTKKREVIIRDV
jgi:hypothetical protein